MAAAWGNPEVMPVCCQCLKNRVQSPGDMCGACWQINAAQILELRDMHKQMCQLAADRAEEIKRLNGALCFAKAQLDTIRDSAAAASDTAAKALGQA